MLKSLVDILKRICFRHKKLYAALILLGTAVSVMEFAFFVLVLPFFNQLLGSNAPLPRFIQAIANSVVNFLPSLNAMQALIVMLLVLTFLKTVLSMFFNYMTGFSSAQVQHELKTSLLKKYVSLPIEFFLNRKQGDLVYTTLVAPSRAALIFLQTPNVLIEGLRTLAITVFIVMVNPKLLFVMLGIAASVILVAEVISRRISYNLGKGRTEASTFQVAIFNEFLSGIKQIKISGQSKRWMSEFLSGSKKFSDLYSKDYIWISSPKVIIEFFTFTILLAASFVLYAKSGKEISSQLPMLGALGLALIKILPSLNIIGRIRMELASCIPDAYNVLNMIDLDYRKEWTGTQKLEQFENEIKIVDLIFSHKERSPVLNRVNCVFKKNTTTAIVGRSGSGKTTILNLLLGLFPPTSGAIRIDGVNLNDLDVQSWRSQIGFVSQDPFIFHASVVENITLGDPSFTRQQVEVAVRLAHAEEFIKQLPQTYDTVVGERGMKLSGGQQQRLAIARALIRNPQILIFDEATSSLDHTSEKLIQQTIASLSNKYTIIIVAHRLTTVTEANNILVLSDGSVVESGTFNELIAKKGVFFGLFDAPVKEASVS